MLVVVQNDYNNGKGLYKIYNVRGCTTDTAKYQYRNNEPSYRNFYSFFQILLYVYRVSLSYSIIIRLYKNSNSWTMTYNAWWDSIDIVNVKALQKNSNA